MHVTESTNATADGFNYTICSIVLCLHRSRRIHSCNQFYLRIQVQRVCLLFATRILHHRPLRLRILMLVRNSRQIIQPLCHRPSVKAKAVIICLFGHLLSRTPVVLLFNWNESVFAPKRNARVIANGNQNETGNETETENVVKGVRPARSGTLRTLAPITEWEATGSRRYKFIHE